MLLQFQISKEFCCSLTFLVFKSLRTLEYSYVKSQLLDKINVKNVVLCTFVIFEMVLFTNYFLFAVSFNIFGVFLSQNPY